MLVYIYLVLRAYLLAAFLVAFLGGWMAALIATKIGPIAFIPLVGVWLAAGVRVAFDEVRDYKRQQVFEQRLAAGEFKGQRVHR